MSATAIGFSLILVSALALTSLGAYRWHRDRRRDREWEAGIAAKPGGRELLEWLRQQRVYWRVGLGCVRAIPAPPAGIEIDDEAVDGEIERMEIFYALDGVNPHEKRRAEWDRHVATALDAARDAETETGEAA